MARWSSAYQHSSYNVGTMMGLVMRTVYYIGDDGSTRLAGCEFTRSKAGKEFAELCYKIDISITYVTEELI